ncbi:MAG: hypothetical protein ACRCTG_16620 [Aestuariivirga sp.]
MARGEAITTRGVPERQQAQLQKDFERIREKVEKLTGERGDTTKSLSAVRRQELRTLPALQSQPVTAAPTAADFNALQADVAAIFAALARISNALGTASIPKV